MELKTLKNKLLLEKERTFSRKTRSETLITAELEADCCGEWISGGSTILPLVYYTCRNKGLRRISLFAFIKNLLKIIRSSYFEKVN